MAHARLHARDKPGRRRRPRMKKVLLALVAIGGAAFALKRQRDRELDEAIWEEPRTL